MWFMWVRPPPPDLLKNKNNLILKKYLLLIQNDAKLPKHTTQITKNFRLFDKVVDKWVKIII